MELNISSDVYLQVKTDSVLVFWGLHKKEKIPLIVLFKEFVSFFPPRSSSWMPEMKVSARLVSLEAPHIGLQMTDSPLFFT